MRILEYSDLDTSHVESNYRKVTEAIARGDFRAAQVKKLSGSGHDKLYRARLDDSDRLLFSLVRHAGEFCALMLEVIRNHDYASSRFLRGAAVDEGRIADIDAPAAAADAQPIRYLHPERTSIHLLDKPISFDDAQDAVFRQTPPLVLVGSAGSGKTALTLEKLKRAGGEVLYVTHSAYLAQSARDLYYSHGFERDDQDAAFLSYREFIESIRVPAGREATWRDFAAWFARMRQSYRDFDPHQVFEEIRGVIAAGAAGALSRGEYVALGVRQSIFAAEHRDRVYDLFGRYREWLAEAKLYDLNLVAHEWLPLAAPRYDFVVVDEVQDMTMAQLALVLRTLKKPGQFQLCGDSNQIVHPNFFSWTQVKSLFWKDPALADRQELRVLTANFRNGLEATRVANQLLKVKQQRFGSIDRESNYLVEATGDTRGQVALIADRDAAKRELDAKIRQSTRFAVLVMRDEDKAEARKHFSTPLLFSIHEAKGLEYENIVLYRFVSDHRAEFGEIAQGVSRADLATDALDYRRAKDKADKSLEVYKFFVNALYVALTRAVSNIYIIESDTAHPLFGLLDVAAGAGAVRIDATKSSLDDWQKEARKLELQGKQEQADAIRRSVLRQVPVPWPVFDEAKVRDLMKHVFVDRAPGRKPRQQLYEYATCFDEPQLARWLVSDAQHPEAKGFAHQRMTLGRSTYVRYFAPQFKDVLKDCERHGIEHRLPMNQTPLIAAAAAGNVALVEALLERGADRAATDHYGWNALHWAMREAFRDPKVARGPFGALYELLAPASVDVNTGDRLVRIDRHISEYFVFQTFWVLFRSRFNQPHRWLNGAVETHDILDAWKNLPANVVRPERNRRQYLSGVLARNEVSRDYAYNRSLFVRVRQGWYQLNPRLSVRVRNGNDEQWTPIYSALNLPLIGELELDDGDGIMSATIDRYLEMAGMPARPVPIALMRTRALEVERMRAIEEERARLLAERERLLAARRQAAPAPPKWGTKEAKRAEVERVRREIEERRKQESSGE